MTPEADSVFGRPYRWLAGRCFVAEQGASNTKPAGYEESAAKGEDHPGSHRSILARPVARARPIAHPNVRRARTKPEKELVSVAGGVPTSGSMVTRPAFVVTLP